ncbi:MAG TPA: hypothetical protein VNN55_08180 [bacterium]|nr:hypothetical protein [bacterium]
MPTLNRTAIVLRPKQPFVDWINETEPDDRPVTLEEVAEDNVVYLIPENRDDDVDRAVRKYWREIFEEELFGWCTDESLWPTRLTFAMFREWFDIEAHSVVRDVGGDDLVIEDE